MSENKGLHDGHRNRVRERFVKEGIDSFFDHQVIEFLLFYGIPRKDTNDIAHNLLNKFGSFSGVFDAPLEALQECGISYNAAVLLKLMPAVCARYYQDKYQQSEKDDLNEEHGTIEDFILPRFIGKNEEQLLMVALDSKGKRVFCDVVSRGTKTGSDVNITKIVQLSVQHKASGVILAHNHPSGSTMPSLQDIKMTENVKQALEAVKILLIEHYIVGDMVCVPMSKSKKAKKIFD